MSEEHAFFLPGPKDRPPSIMTMVASDEEKITRLGEIYGPNPDPEEISHAVSFLYSLLEYKPDKQTIKTLVNSAWTYIFIEGSIAIIYLAQAILYGILGNHYGIESLVTLEYLAFIKELDVSVSCLKQQPFLDTTWVLVPANVVGAIMSVINVLVMYYEQRQWTRTQSVNTNYM